MHPLGLVDKKSTEEPFRIIHDCREDNQTIVRWPSRLHGISASAFLFSRKAWVFTLDLKAAYLTVSLRGCGGGLRPTGARRLDGSPEYIVGCSTRDGSCQGGCDKDRLGFVWGTPFCLNAPPFGMTVSGNALEILTSPLVRRWARKGLRIILWIDDLCCIVRNPHAAVGHPTWFLLPPGSALSSSDFQLAFVECCGLQSCSACQSSFARACDLRAAFLSEIRDLGWRTNEKESGLPDMAGEFIGVPFDTDSFTFSLTDAKRDKLVRRAAKALRLVLLTPRRVSKL